MPLWLSDNSLTQTGTQCGSEEMNLVFYAAGCVPGSTREVPRFLQHFYAAESKSSASKPAFFFFHLPDWKMPVRICGCQSQEVE